MATVQYHERLHFMDASTSQVLDDADLVLQRIIVDRPIEKRGLYWWHDTGTSNTSELSGQRVDAMDGALRIQPYCLVSFDTYFNAFYESIWRQHTRLGTLLLRVSVEGHCTMRVRRRSAGAERIVHEQVLTSETVTIAFEDVALNFRQHGLLGLELETGAAAARFIEGAWLAAGCAADISTVGLSAIICTFNREADVGRVLASIAADATLVERLTGVFVISQGRPGLAEDGAAKKAAAALGRRLHILEQPNFGGAGGFGRGLLETLDDPGTTHAVLLDDDIALETDSLFRMAAFFALCRKPIILGGHMLDSIHPTRLYEAGAIISERHWAFQPQHHSQDLLDHAVLETLTHPNAVHYNGWWCCGIPLSLVREHGMPLPCFIRGDDLEYGLRLHNAGVPTVAIPGIAVWHEPFYLKIGNWHLYYETRNMLIAASLHQPIARWEVVRRMGRQLAMNLLTFRYYNTALILTGIRDYLAGPGILESAPQPVHNRITALRALYPASLTSRGTVLEPQRLRAAPRSKASFLLTLLVLTLRNLLVPTRIAPRRSLPVRDLVWPLMSGVEHIAVETWWDEELPTFQRSREHFRTLARESAGMLATLYREAPARVRTWQAAYSMLTSEPFWRSYLGLIYCVRCRGSQSLVDQDRLDWMRCAACTDNIGSKTAGPTCEATASDGVFGTAITASSSHAGTQGPCSSAM